MRRRDVIRFAFGAVAAMPPLRHAASAAPPRRADRPSTARWETEGPQRATSWRKLKIGAGGFVVGLDVAPDGTLLARADTHGAWVWEPKSCRWRALITYSTMPAEDRNEDSPAINWPLDLAVSPSDTKRFYMALDGRVYRSIDSGETWSRTACPTLSGMSGVAPSARMNGRKIAVDPRDPDIVYVAPPRGRVIATRDGGATWSEVSAIAGAGERQGEPMGGLVIFDPYSSAVDGRTSKIYASVWGDGVHASEDGGVTWMKLQNGPSQIKHAAVAPDRTLYVVSGTDDGGAGQVLRYDGSWTDVTPPAATPEAWQSVTASTFHPGRLVVSKEEGSLCESLDRGASWFPLIHRSKLVRRAVDVPWLAWTDEPWVSGADVRFDPTSPDRLLFAQGLGVWTTEFAKGASAVTWLSQSDGIEQLVANQCVHPPHEGATPLLACWDRPIWRVADADSYQVRHYPDPEFKHCWGLDCASDDPRFVVATLSTQQATDLERSGYSADGGKTWRQFASFPKWAGGKSGKGFIAVSTAANLVWSSGDGGGLPHYTTDGGKHWRQCVIPGAAAEDAPGFGWANYIRRFGLCADRVRPGVFYLLHHPKGLFVTEDGGRKWSLRHRFDRWSGRFHTKLRATPGFAGHLFHTAGHSSEDRHGDFVRSVDGGRTWTVVAGVKEVSDFAFGKAAPGFAYPSVIIVGYVFGEWGIFSSHDDCASWLRISDGFPIGSLDRIVAIEADKNNFGKVYVGFMGSGWAYGVA